MAINKAIAISSIDLTGNGDEGFGGVLCTLETFGKAGGGEIGGTDVGCETV